MFGSVHKSLVPTVRPPVVCRGFRHNNPPLPDRRRMLRLEISFLGIAAHRNFRQRKLPNTVITRGQDIAPRCNARLCAVAMAD